jgi:peptide-methionine (R)-S-oxide reductase
MQRRSLLLAGTASAAGLGLAFLARGHSVAEGMPDGHVFAVARTEDEWRRILTPAQYDVLRDHGTEPPYSSPLDHEKRPGTFRCAGCGQDLFSSAAKFDSGTGWPSFTAPLEGAIGTSEDRSFFMVRTEVHCSRCGGHLGHAFEDGPPPTGLRYCMNGVAMTFAPADGSVS